MKWWTDCCDQRFPGFKTPVCGSHISAGHWHLRPPQAEAGTLPPLFQIAGEAEISVPCEAENRWTKTDIQFASLCLKPRKSRQKEGQIGGLVLCLKTASEVHKEQLSTVNIWSCHSHESRAKRWFKKAVQTCSDDSGRRGPSAFLSSMRFSSKNSPLFQPLFCSSAPTLLFFSHTLRLFFGWPDSPRFVPIIPSFPQPLLSLTAEGEGKEQSSLLAATC